MPACAAQVSPRNEACSVNGLLSISTRDPPATAHAMARQRTTFALTRQSKIPSLNQSKGALRSARNLVISGFAWPDLFRARDALSRADQHEPAVRRTGPSVLDPTFSLTRRAKAATVFGSNGLAKTGAIPGLLPLDARNKSGHPRATALGR
jgi:hypothetical protein